MPDNQKSHIESSAATVAVLIGYYHGEKYIIEQLKSILDQDHEVSVWISDDGDDNQLEPLLVANNLYPDPRIHLLKGPKKGFAKNFISLIQNEDIKADYFAFADQDDIWFKDKLSRAIAWLQTLDKSYPGCYCSRTHSIDEDGNHLGLSQLFTREPSFQNALVQSLAGANTMVFNRAGRQILKDYTKCDVVSHDWWAYMLITGVGGKVFYDREPSLYYRQHGNNIVGSNNSLLARLKRIHLLGKGRFKNWNNTNLAALKEASEVLTAENNKIRETFSKSLSHTFFLTRMILLFKSGVYRQTFFQNIGLYLASMLNKL